mmetsp:Transcript_71127/g.148756  ORF Transcript_71127/g.148756 Transcript_71127/m.148756 type:complete len:99 (-) Transcript_71127:75-371(-)
MRTKSTDIWFHVLVMGQQVESIMPTGTTNCRKEAQDSMQQPMGIEQPPNAGMQHAFRSLNGYQESSKQFAAAISKPKKILASGEVQSATITEMEPGIS